MILRFYLTNPRKTAPPGAALYLGSSQFGQLGTQNISNLANVGLQSYSALSNGWGQYGNLGMQVSNYNQNAWAQNQQAKAQGAAGIGSMVGGLAMAAGTAF